MKLREIIEEYMEAKTLAKNTSRNFKAFAAKLKVFENLHSISFMIEDYDILAVSGPERRDRIKLYANHWGKFIEFLQKSGVNAPQSRNTYAAMQGTLCNYILKNYGYQIIHQEKEKALPFEDRKIVIPDNAVQRILNMPMSLHWAVPAIKLAIYSCWRVSDLIQLTGEDLKIGEFMGQPCYYIQRVQKKTGIPVKTPVPTSLIKYMLRKNPMPGEKLIQHPKGNKVTERTLSNAVRDAMYADSYLRSVSVSTYNAGGKAVEIKLPEIPKPMHILRSAGASLLIKRGMTPESVARWFTGHKNLDTLQRHYVTSDNFTMAKDVLTDRFGSQMLNEADSINALYEEE